MSRTEYSTIQIPRITKLKIEDFRRRHGYPSNSQAVTALVERGDVAEDIKSALTEELRKTLANEAGSMILKTMYQLLIDIIRISDKPISELTLNEAIGLMRKIEPT